MRICSCVVSVVTETSLENKVRCLLSCESEANFKRIETCSTFHGTIKSFRHLGSMKGGTQSLLPFAIITIGHLMRMTMNILGTQSCTLGLAYTDECFWL